MPAKVSMHSKALEANLQTTRVSVEIPEEQRLLLTASQQYLGIHRQVEKLLLEVNHPFIGWAWVSDELHARAMGDFFHFNRFEQGQDALAIFHSLYKRIIIHAKPIELRNKAIRNWVLFIEKCITDSGQEFDRNQPMIRQALLDLQEIIQSKPKLSLVVSARIKKLLYKLIAIEDSIWDLVSETVFNSLQHTYDFWMSQEDPIEWYHEGAHASSAAHEDRVYPQSVMQISHEAIKQHANQLEDFLHADIDISREEFIHRVKQLPDNSSIVHSYLDVGTRFESDPQDKWKALVHRLFWLFKILGSQALQSIHEVALRDINACLVDVLRGGDRNQLEPVIRKIFSVLREGHFTFHNTILGSIRTIGLEIIATGDDKLLDLLLDEIIAYDFEYPNLSGVNEEWQTKVNPAHIKNIRTYLDLIEADPVAMKRLLSALVINLHLGGVFIADTDLFQKDISSLLNSNIEPVYHLVKHLLRLFPAYYNEIGAEGEIREVSTNLDEIRARKDPLSHFIRKQCHVESNPLLVNFISNVARFWATGDKAGLRSYVPAGLYERLNIDDDMHRGLHTIFSSLAERPGRMGPLFGMQFEELQHKLSTFTDVNETDRLKAQHLLRLHHLLHKKYNVDHIDVIATLRASNQFEKIQIEALEGALRYDDYPTALEILLEMLEHLKHVMLNPKKSEGHEDIYLKRHIAVGIPSMYGIYREEKFEAVGLTLRIESMTQVLFERMVASQNLEYITRSTLFKISGWLRLFLRALRVEGYRVRGLEMRIEMLETALDAHGITVDQYINIFQFISRNIKNLIRVRFIEVYENSLNRIVPRMVAQGVLNNQEDIDQEEYTYQVSESFLRELISQSFALQTLDNLVGKILQTLDSERQNLDGPTLTLLMSYDVERCFSPISVEETDHDDLIHLGNKGFMLKRLASFGFPIPAGFILTTEVFRCLPAILAHDELREENVEHIFKHVARLERQTKFKYGDAENPLILSVRSGASMSMPGMLYTFLNVGLNPEIADGLARQTGAVWSAWDSYRRFLQCWGMSFGISRDVFDKLIRDAKTRGTVKKKSNLSDRQMRDLAMQYREAIRDHGVDIVDDPHLQLRIAVDQVLNSWSTENARLYRQQMQIAEEWGTAVIIQNMVYGNLSPTSGTGVVFTRHPSEKTEAVQLYGDFVIQGQGEDVVGGLVDTVPVSEYQRLTDSSGYSISLQKDFPDIYNALLKHAHTLVYDIGMNHQEIEFTFEGSKAENLYILQIRDMVVSEKTTLPTFVPSSDLEKSKVAMGIAAGGGALTGRVAHSYQDIQAFRVKYPDDDIILLRPDTVPEDILLIVESDGLLTSLGGSTSHAAVAAQRIGRTCVVGCKALRVYEDRHYSEIANHTLKSGDYISINGHDGSIYLGQHPIKMTRIDAFLTR